jgi:16S rRNA G966 N2-methylase RsmD
LNVSSKKHLQNIQEYDEKDEELVLNNDLFFEYNKIKKPATKVEYPDGFNIHQRFSTDAKNSFLVRVILDMILNEFKVKQFAHIDLFAGYGCASWYIAQSDACKSVVFVEKDNVSLKKIKVNYATVDQSNTSISCKLYDILDGIQNNSRFGSYFNKTFVTIHIDMPWLNYDPLEKTCPMLIKGKTRKYGIKDIINWVKTFVNGKHLFIVKQPRKNDIVDIDGYYTFKHVFKNLAHVFYLRKNFNPLRVNGNIIYEKGHSVDSGYYHISAKNLDELLLNNFVGLKTPRWYHFYSYPRLTGMYEIKPMLDIDNYRNGQRKLLFNEIRFLKTAFPTMDNVTILYLGAGDFTHSIQMCYELTNSHFICFDKVDPKIFPPDNNKNNTFDFVKGEYSLRYLYSLIDKYKNNRFCIINDIRKVESTDFQRFIDDRNIVLNVKQYQQEHSCYFPCSFKFHLPRKYCDKHLRNYNSKDVTFPQYADIPGNFELWLQPWSSNAGNELRLTYLKGMGDDVELDLLATRQRLMCFNVCRSLPAYRYDYSVDKEYEILGLDLLGYKGISKSAFWDKMLHHYYGSVDINEVPAFTPQDKLLRDWNTRKRRENRYSDAKYFKMHDAIYSEKKDINKKYVPLLVYHGEYDRKVVCFDVGITSSEYEFCKEVFPEHHFYYCQDMNYRVHRKTRFERTFAEYQFFYDKIFPSVERGDALTINVLYGGPSRYSQWFEIDNLYWCFYDHRITMEDKTAYNNNNFYYQNYQNVYHHLCPYDVHLYNRTAAANGNSTYECLECDRDKTHDITFSVDSMYYYRKITHGTIVKIFGKVYQIFKIWNNTNGSVMDNEGSSYLTLPHEDNEYGWLVERLDDYNGTFTHRNYHELLDNRRFKAKYVELIDGIGTCPCNWSCSGCDDCQRNQCACTNFNGGFHSCASRMNYSYHSNDDSCDSHEAFKDKVASHCAERSDKGCKCVPTLECFLKNLKLVKTCCKRKKDKGESEEKDDNEVKKVVVEVSNNEKPRSMVSDVLPNEGLQDDTGTTLLGDLDESDDDVIDNIKTIGDVVQPKSELLGICNAHIPNDSEPTTIEPRKSMNIEMVKLEEETKEDNIEDQLNEELRDYTSSSTDIEYKPKRRFLDRFRTVHHSPATDIQNLDSIEAYHNKSVGGYHRISRDDDQSNDHDSLGAADSQNGFMAPSVQMNAPHPQADVLVDDHLFHRYECACDCNIMQTIRENVRDNYHLFRNLVPCCGPTKAYSETEIQLFVTMVLGNRRYVPGYFCFCFEEYDANLHPSKDNTVPNIIGSLALPQLPMHANSYIHTLAKNYAGRSSTWSTWNAVKRKLSELSSDKLSFVEQNLIINEVLETTTNSQFKTSLIMNYSKSMKEWIGNMWVTGPITYFVNKLRLESVLTVFDYSPPCLFMALLTVLIFIIGVWMRLSLKYDVNYDYFSVETSHDNNIDQHNQRHQRNVRRLLDGNMTLQEYLDFNNLTLNHSIRSLLVEDDIDLQPKADDWLYVDATFTKDNAFEYAEYFVEKTFVGRAWILTAMAWCFTFFYQLYIGKGVFYSMFVSCIFVFLFGFLYVMLGGISFTASACDLVLYPCEVVPSDALCNNFAITRSKILGYNMQNSTLVAPAPHGSIRVLNDPYLVSEEDSVQARAYGPHSIYVPLIQVSNIFSDYCMVRNRCILDLQIKYNVQIDWQARYDFVDWWEENFIKCFGNISNQSKMQFSEWLSRYTGPKLREKLVKLQDYYDKVLEDSCDDFQKNVFTRKPFSKREMICKQFTSSFTPRLVTGAHTELNMVFGPYTYSMGKVLASTFGKSVECEYIDGITRYDNIIYCSGLSRHEIGKRYYEYVTTCESHDIAVFESDESRFDSHQDSFLINFVHHMYKKFLPVNEAILKVFKSRVIGCHGTTPHKVQYKNLNGSRGSGDQDTTLGNSLLLVLRWIYIYRTAFGWRFERPHLRCFLLGDDNYTIGPKKDIELFARVTGDISRRLGFTSKSEIKTPHNASFCSSIFTPVIYKNVATFYLTPSIGNVLCRTFMNVHHLGFSIRKSNAYAKCIFLGLYRDIYHITPIRYLFDHMLVLLNEVKISKMVDKFDVYKNNKAVSNDKGWTYQIRRWNKNLCDGDDRTLAYLETRYGITDDMIISFKKLVDTLPSPFVIIDHELYNRFVLIDSFGMTIPEAEETISSGKSAIIDDSHRYILEDIPINNICTNVANRLAPIFRPLDNGFMWREPVSRILLEGLGTN